MSVEFVSSAFNPLNTLASRAALTGRKEWPSAPIQAREPQMSAPLTRAASSTTSSRPFSREDRLKLFLSTNCMEKFDIPLSTVDNSFACNFPGCKKTFEKKRQLLEHWRVAHPSTKPYMCKFHGCNKSFLRPAHLMIHERIHTGEKPYVCEFEGCGKRWSQKSALTQHMRSHTGEKPFICPVENCGKRFSTSSSCKRHMTIHSDNKKGNTTAPAGHDTSSSPISTPPQSPMHVISDEQHEHEPSQRSHHRTASSEETTEEINKRMALTFIMN